MKNHKTLPGFSEVSYAGTRSFHTIARWSAIDIVSKIIPNDTCCGTNCPDGCSCSHGHAHCFANAVTKKGNNNP